MTTDSPARARRRRASATDQARIAASQVGATLGHAAGRIGGGRRRSGVRSARASVPSSLS
ncbi:hypothetical protein ACRAWB_04320 [Leifsonia poae]|uniref:hypothetical protein n=1 Tax=Leifsonia poae TaxID=110933 RepID=UPI003D68368E